MKDTKICEREHKGGNFEQIRIPFFQRDTNLRLPVLVCILFFLTNLGLKW